MYLLAHAYAVAIDAWLVGAEAGLTGCAISLPLASALTHRGTAVPIVLPIAPAAPAIAWTGIDYERPGQDRPASPQFHVEQWTACRSAPLRLAPRPAAVIFAGDYGGLAAIRRARPGDRAADRRQRRQRRMVVGARKAAAPPPWWPSCPDPSISPAMSRPLILGGSSVMCGVGGTYVESVRPLQPRGRGLAKRLRAAPCLRHPCLDLYSHGCATHRTPCTPSAASEHGAAR